MNYLSNRDTSAIVGDDFRLKATSGIKGGIANWPDDFVVTMPQCMEKQILALSLKDVPTKNMF